MDFPSCFTTQRIVLMEGALGTRLRGEYHLAFDENVAMAAMIYTEQGRAALHALWTGYAQVARRFGLPFLAVTPTRRANRERVCARHSAAILEDNVRFLQAVQRENAIPMYVGGLMGCRGDAYTGAGALEAAEARRFHGWQADRLARAGADFLYAGIMPTLPEAVGMAQAMADTGLPYIISFTLLKTGMLPDKTPLHAAIERIDAAVGHGPVCYMTNCVHPDIVGEALSQPFNKTVLVRGRFRGIQANASPLPPEELDNAAELRRTSPQSLAQSLKALGCVMDLKIVGGCCGTDERFLAAMAEAMTGGKAPFPG